MLQVASDTRVLTAASGAFLLLLAASWVSNRSGFAGYLEPQQALDLLRRQNACLIDTRYAAYQAMHGGFLPGSRPLVGLRG